MCKKLRQAQVLKEPRRKVHALYPEGQLPAVPSTPRTSTAARARPLNVVCGHDVLEDYGSRDLGLDSRPRVWAMGLQADRITVFLQHTARVATLQPCVGAAIYVCPASEAGE